MLYLSNIHLCNSYESDQDFKIVKNNLNIDFCLLPILRYNKLPPC